MDDGALGLNDHDQVDDGKNRVDVTLSGKMPEKKNAISSDQTVSFLSAKIDTFELNGRSYKVIKALSETSGEAQVYLMENDGANYVLKLYYPNFSPKLELLKILNQLNNVLIVKLHDYGIMSQGKSSRCFEIMEYLEGGSLDNFPFSPNDEKTFRKITLDAATSLLICHNHGIIHKDVKLSNFFFRDKEKQQLVLGDFGISSLRKDDEELLRTTQSRTPIYAAPEMYANVINGEVELTTKIDFYSLGITLLHWYLGKNPFIGNERLMMRQKSEGKLPNIHLLPEYVNRLIRGLTIVNPEFRWGYEEVNRWCKGENVPVNDDIPCLLYRKFMFDPDNDLVAANPRQLAGFMKKDRKSGIRYLYNKKIAKWLEDSGNFKLSVELDEIVEKCFPFDQAAGLKAAIYVLDSNQPFLLDSTEPTFSPEEIVKAFSKGKYTEDDFKALTDGRLLFWLSNKELPIINENIRALINENENTKGLAYGVLFALDKSCGFTLAEYTNREDIGVIISDVLIASQKINDPKEFEENVDDFLGEKSMLYYYCKIHGWDDIIRLRDLYMDVNSKNKNEHLGEYNIFIAAYKFCKSLGFAPGYLLAESNEVIYSIEEMKNLPLKVIKRDIKNSKLNYWLTIFYHEDPFNQFEPEYSYEKTLSDYLVLIDNYNHFDYYCKRFFSAKENHKNKIHEFRQVFKWVQLIEILFLLLFLVCGVSLIYLVQNHAIPNQELFLFNYYYAVGAPLVIYGLLYFGIKSFHLSLGVILSVLFTLFGVALFVSPALVAYWLLGKYPGEFNSIITCLICFYMGVLIVMGLSFSTIKYRNLKILGKETINSTLLEPLFFTYKTSVSKYKGTDWKLLNDGLEVIKTVRRKLLTHYIIWTLLICCFLIIYVCFHPDFIGIEIGEITKESLKEFFRFRGSPATSYIYDL